MPKHTSSLIKEPEMTRKLPILRRDAREAAAWRGHDMRPFQQTERETAQTAVCRRILRRRIRRIRRILRRRIRRRCPA